MCAQYPRSLITIERLGNKTGALRARGFCGTRVGGTSSGNRHFIVPIHDDYPKKKKSFLSRVCVTLHLFLFHFLFCFLMFRIDDAAEMGADRQLYPQTSSNNKSKTIEA